MNRRQRGGGNLGVLLLGGQLLSAGVDNVPPVTLVAVLAQAAVYLGFFPTFGPRNTYRWCLHAGRVWWGNEWWRIVPSQFMHADDMHLYYNMASLLWKGRRLERKVGSRYFAALLFLLSALTGATMVVLAVGLEDVLEIKQFGLVQQCAVGFSGVLFALKVITNHHFPGGSERLFGWIPVPGRWACWAELALIQVLVPSASFLGHLAGILVGIAFIHTPLQSLFNAFFEREWEGRPRRGRTYGTGTWGEGALAAAWTGGASEEEQLRRAMRESEDQTYRRPRPSAPPLYPDVTGFR